MNTQQLLNLAGTLSMVLLIGEMERNGNDYAKVTVSNKACFDRTSTSCQFLS